ncbi:uncharacterized protein MELLADRAFT_89420 [Melampsora larici-populina 98AG31]|uniref:Uncharacterized protein n=1 Tax=Melampsora larici-populina (strain 98AG31 / pathotype 3-4-7) TaxID=747676 RepID=F4SE90_MELLP|nr:uncharacterized protein MELLADRAFT_89420 [Melampsora larici-populina 98AG31]EGF97034.1 hypothetical protein MELLADRAFT_89420 [Melampsora larici-populina 98AG31]
MNGNRYIKHQFMRIDPSPLNSPHVNSLVGFACPTCLENGKITPMKYIAYNYANDSWCVACGITPPKPPPNSGLPKPRGHFYRTWLGPQLKQEIASINAGLWPPSPFATPASASAITALNNDAPEERPTASQQILNQFLPAPLPKNPSKAAEVLCRGVDGRTGQAHSRQVARKGNQQCVYQACASVSLHLSLSWLFLIRTLIPENLQCCQTLGTLPCGAKRHKRETGGGEPALSVNLPAPAPLPLPASIAPTQPGPSSQGLSTTSTHRRITHQSAQTGGKLAHELTQEQLAALFDMRAARREEMKTNARLATDSSKVVDVIWWSEAGQDPQVITFEAPQWPRFMFTQFSSLITEATVKASLSEGTTWTRRLSLWDPNFLAWRSVPIEVPNLLPTFPRQIFVKLDHIDASNCPQLDRMLYRAYESDETFTSGPNIPHASGSRLTTTPISTPSQQLPQRQQSPFHLQQEDVPDVIWIQDQFTSAGPSIAKSNTNQPPKTSTTLVLGQAKKLPWPNDEAPLHDVVDWVDLTKTSGLARLKSWKISFGENFTASESTIYRYHRWIKFIEDVGEGRIAAWEHAQKAVGTPVTIEAARKEFSLEYQAAGAPPKRKDTSSMPEVENLRKKRKLGE